VAESATRETGECGDSTSDSGSDWRAYLFALAPVLVVLGVAPALALALPPVRSLDLGPGRFVGVALVLAGLTLVAWAVDSFARAGEPPSPADSPERLVTRGALAYTRNPLYLGTVAAAAGAGVAFESVVVIGYAALLWVAYHLLTVYHEEPELREELGERYEAYCERVPRWL
jgi:protein-S-isoprenylcysteine O-methyltransferase Ste14